jgi:glycosyltransferase involved in cell wall biosynthesis
MSSRILTVSHFFESHGGGIERVAGHLCREFVRQGEIAVWCASDGDKLPGPPIEAIGIGCANPTERLTGLPMPIPGPTGFRTLRNEVAGCDAVVIHDALYVTSILAMLLAKAQRKRTIIIQHISEIPFPLRLLRGLMRMANFVVTRPMLRAADACVFISDTVRQDLAVGGLESELLFNGVDGTIFNSSGSSDAKPAQVGSIDNRKRRVLFVGRYVEKKGLGVLRELAKICPDMTVLLAGCGPMSPTSWGLPNIHDLGPQPPDELADLYRWADCLVLPSVGEGYPLVIQEAMACGLPVICGEPANRADPAASKWLRGVPIDLSRPQQSAQRCAEAIGALNLTAEERLEMSRYALREYDWGRMARKIIALTKAPADA